MSAPSKQLVRWTLWLSLSLAFVLGLSHSAQADFFTSYTVTIDEDVPDIDNLILLEEGSGFGSSSWVYSAGGFGSTSQIQNPFSSSAPPHSSLFLGLVRIDEGGGEESDHLVMFLNAATASAIEGLSFEEAFPDTDLAALIQAVIDVTTADGDWEQVDAGIAVIDLFLFGDARNVLGESLSVYFDTEGPFQVMRWSSGTIIGSGFGQIVPEPSTVTLLGLGTAFGLLALRRPRR